MKKKTIKVLLADDHPIFRDGLCRAILTEPAFSLVHETGDGQDALNNARKLKPDILLLDIRMPGLNGLELARIVQRERLKSEVVLLTNYKEERLFQEAMNLGVKGYVLKESAAADVREAILEVAKGEPYISPSLASLVVKREFQARTFAQSKPGLECLTPAERRILKLVAEDNTTKEIADVLGLSPRTVDNHRANICSKLGLFGTNSLLRFAIENRERL